MQIIQPTRNNLNTFTQLLRWAQSVFKAMTHSIAFAQPTAQASTGVYNTFVQDNIDGVMLYVGANGSGAPIFWAGTNVGQNINHGLQRQPIGFFPVYKNKTCDIYSTATPTTNVISLAVTDDTATVILFVF